MWCNFAGVTSPNLYWMYTVQVNLHHHQSLIVISPVRYCIKLGNLIRNSTRIETHLPTFRHFVGFVIVTYLLFKCTLVNLFPPKTISFSLSLISVFILTVIAALYVTMSVGRSVCRSTTSFNVSTEQI